MEVDLVVTTVTFVTIIDRSSAVSSRITVRVKDRVRVEVGTVIRMQRGVILATVSGLAARGVDNGRVGNIKSQQEVVGGCAKGPRRSIRETSIPLWRGLALVGLSFMAFVDIALSLEGILQTHS